ncbi:MAG: hypothetical protein M0015_05240 [Betaproteobacteria bacterium]|nr:hypothetical protein [Betaproteobacteria bacterium]
MGVAADALLDLPAWQAILDREAGVFAELAPGASVGFVPRRVAGPDGALRSSAMPSVAPLEMLAWERDAGGMTACLRSYRGLADAGCDVLFFCERGALEAVLARAGSDALGEMKRRIRAGAILLMVLRTRGELRARGYEDFLESLGLPFMGACR